MTRLATQAKNRLHAVIQRHHLTPPAGNPFAKAKNDWWQGLARVEAAHVAANSHPRWKAELARLQPRLGYNKAIVAIARKLLITVWYVLARKVADRFAEAEKVSEKMLRFAYKVGKENRPGDKQRRNLHARASMLWEWGRS